MAVIITALAGLSGCNQKGENPELREIKAQDRQKHEAARKAGKKFADKAPR